MANQPTLLGLPVELRLHIYKYISPVISGSPISAFRGIFLSCKQLYNEASTEVLKNGRKAVATLEGELQSSHGNIQVSAPQRLHDLTSLTVTLPVTLPIVATGQLNLKSVMDDVLQQMLVFHINSITIHHYEGYCGTTRLNLRMRMKIEETVNGSVSVSVEYDCDGRTSSTFIVCRVGDFVDRNFSALCEIKVSYASSLGYATCRWTTLGNHGTLSN